MGKALIITPFNLLRDWGSFESWSDGSAVAPDGWILSAGSVVLESTIIKFGLYSAKVTDSGALQLDITDYLDYQGRTMTLGFWVYATQANMARIAIDDGVSSVAYSSYHTGGGSWEFLSVTAQIASNASRLRAIIAGTGYFDDGLLVQGEETYLDLSPYVESWKPDLKINKNTYKIARRDGILIPDTTLNERATAIRCVISGATAAATRILFDAIIKSLRAWDDTEKRQLYLFDDRVVDVFLDGISWDYGASMKIINLDLKFTAADSTERYLSRLRKKQVVSATPTAFNLVYGGNAVSRPVIYIIADQGGDVTACSLSNLTTGENLAFTGTITSGKTLKIDCDNILVENDGVDALATFSGDFMKLVKGTNYFSFAGSNCTIKIDWFDRWI